MSKKTKAETGDTSTLKDLFKSLAKDFGEEAGLPIKLRGVQEVPRFSSGLLGLDRMLGGGIPIGRIMEVYGAESSGKTSLCLNIVAAAQQQGMTAAFIDAEHSLDTMWAEKLGVDIGTMLFEQPMSGEQSMEFAKALVLSGKVDLIIVDSVAALTPLAEIKGEIGEAHMARLARLMSQSMRILAPLCMQNKVTMIFTNQIRMNIGVMFGNPETTTGGNALKFFASARINVSRNKITDKDVRVGDTVRLKLIKSKVSPPYQQVEIDLRYDEGFDKVQELLTEAVAAGKIARNGSWYSYEGVNIGQGEPQTKAYLIENPEVRTKLLGDLTNRT